jgi:nicotinamidase-related amidase
MKFNSLEHHLTQSVHLAIDYQNRFLFPQDATGQTQDIAGTQLLHDVIHATRLFSHSGVSTLWVTTGQKADWRRLPPTQHDVLRQHHDVPPPLSPIMRGTHCIKTGDSAFSNPTLLPFLRERGVTELFISGLYLHHCVLATVQDALVAGLRCTLLVDLLRDSQGETSTALRHRQMSDRFAQNPHIKITRLALLPQLRTPPPHQKILPHYRSHAPALTQNFHALRAALVG